MTNDEMRDRVIAWIHQARGEGFLDEGEVQPLLSWIDRADAAVGELCRLTHHKRGDGCSIPDCRNYRPASPTPDPEPGAFIRVNVGEHAGFRGHVQPRQPDDPPGWIRLRSDAGLRATRLFPSRELEPVTAAGRTGR